MRRASTSTGGAFFRPTTIAAYLLLAQTLATCQASSPPRLERIEVGIAGAYKLGLGTPVAVTLDQPAETPSQIVLIASDSDGTPVRYATDCSGTDHVVLHARLGRAGHSITAQLVTDDKLIDQRVLYPTGQRERAADQPIGDVFHPPVGGEQPLVLVVGNAQEPMAAALRALRGPIERRPDVVAVADFNDLPCYWLDYEAVDTVLLAPGDLTGFATIGPDDPRLEALDKWLRLGGRLVLCVGENAAWAFQDVDAPLARFAPGRFEQMVTLRKAAAFEMYAESSTPIVLDGSADAPWLRLPTFTSLEATIDARDGAIPIVTHRAHGLGSVTYFAGDIGCAPLATWRDVGRLVVRLLNVVETGDARPATHQIMHVGYYDLAGQLRSALDRFDGVWAAPFTLIVALIVFYLALVGPLDYYLVHRVLKRPVLTWVTLPVYIVSFCLLAALLNRSLRSTTPLVHQIDLLDVDVAAGRLRGTSWANVYSPSAARYDVTFQPRLLGVPRDSAIPTEVVTSWFGLTGSAIGGMDSTTLQAVDWREPYDRTGDLSVLRGVPIKPRSTKSFTARWEGPVLNAPASEFRESGGVVTGNVMNTLDVPLRNCLLIHRGWAYKLGDLPPGALATIGAEVTRRELSRLLTDTKLTFDERKSFVTEESTPYDQTSVDVEYILRAMMFYRAAGGSHYTRLGGQHQRFIDMSNLLATDRAMVIGTVDASELGPSGRGAEVTLALAGRPVDFQTTYTTVCRFVFPVINEDATRD